MTAAIADEYVLLKSIDDSTGQPRRRSRFRVALDIVLVAAAAAYLIWVIQFFIDESKVATFSVELAAVERLNATAAAGRATVSPWFLLAAKVENPRALEPWCSIGGRAVVSYGGVSLAWGPVPGFCLPTKGAAEMEVAAEGRGVGMSEDLRRRFVEEWNAGTARVLAEMKLFYNGNGKSGTRAYEGVSLVWRQLTLPGQGPP
ncbi:unnamed protein product [Urochloa decumbens]|uniref:Uncharacterized protein n=1 Tax=Urochloa decumbens TaxID=240449 RepID=A0ABC8ZV74_9POAL